MSVSDHEYVNFSQDHELNYHLRKWNKAQSIANRSVLKTMGEELKRILNANMLTHKQFDDYISGNLHRLDN